ncbi:MAG: sigma-70 family RNA polymerase sigma factor [Candidatus Sericytochromatia bacterium]|nr:sigma-70 family RNA polymerase sigma factor [Candidatus Tanganyikabacteria bacterium]
MPATPEQMHLVRRALDGDKRAFEILVDPSLDRLYALAHSLAGNPDDAADVLQDALLKAYRALGSFRGTSDVHGWLCRIVRNTVLDEFKKASRRHEEPTDQVPERAGGGLEKQLEDKQLGEVVREAVDALSDKLRGPLLLYDLEGYDYQEIATMLDLNLGTVKSRLNRARESLRQTLLDRKDRWSSWLEGRTDGLPTG